MKKSHARSGARRKAVTIRLSLVQLRKLMRARRVATQSELIHRLLDEEEERLAAEAVLRETTGVAGKEDFDDRLL